MCDEQLEHLHRRPPIEREVTRQVRFAHGDDDGNVAVEERKTMPIYTNNLMHLRLKQITIVVQLAPTLGH
jgi:hypothetical protein